MKRFVFGLWLSLLGFLGTMTCLVCGVRHSRDYNGLSGVWGGLEDTQLYIPLLIFLLVMLAGLVAAAREARREGRK